jgi:NitT/TauT family transport system substrate-binding protein
VRTIDVPAPAAGGQIVSRRELLRLTLGTGAMLAGGGLLAACAQQPSVLGTSATLPPPETTTVRIVTGFACDPPLWLAKEFLLEEGFTDIQFVAARGRTRDWVTGGIAEFGPGHPEEVVAAIDAGVPIVALAGIHSGCQEVWVGPGIAGIRDLRGKRIAVFAKNTGDQFFGFFATTLAYVGIDPVKDVNFYEVGPDYAALMKEFVEGRSDAFLAAAEGAALLHRNPRTPSTKILDQSADKPWSQYVCCLLLANRDWTRQHPVAAERVTRAVMRAADATVKDLPRAAHEGAARGIQSILPPSGVSLEQILNESITMPSYAWRELDPEETLRFFALRLGDVKLITSTPQQIVAQGSDVAYLRQLQKELKP